jgi:adenine-specific DNA-methyltransferase
MRYFGSKISVLDEITATIRSLGDFSTVCDPFGGVGTVATALRQGGYRVTTGDQLAFAHCFQIARLEVTGAPRLAKLRRHLDGADVATHLDDLPGEHGWITETYAVHRRFFTLPNARRVDAIWRALLRWRGMQLTSRSEHALLMASLIDSTDRIANTAGTYHAHLKTFAPRMRKPFRYRLLPPVRGPRGRARLGDALATATAADADVLYLDPPYNRRNYGGYYHLPETLARGDQPVVRGAAGLPDRPLPQSSFYVRREASGALERLVREAPWRALVLHYADDGLVHPEAIRQILEPLGAVDDRVVVARGFSTVGSRSTLHRIYTVRR